MRKRNLAILVVLGIQNILAQSSTNIPTITPMVPEANALFKYIDTPVSNTTGVPNISIPIYDIQLKDFVLPISLSYHSAGTKIDDISTAIGLGWTLNAGGMISSQVYGVADLHVPRADYPLSRELFPVTECDNGLGAILQGDYNFLKPIADSEGTLDSQPDIFYYNCGSLSGKFFIAADKSVHTMPFVPIKIEMRTNYPMIVDEKGNKYTFGIIEAVFTNSGTVTTNEFFPGGGGTSINEVYHISKIETPNGQIISFNYVDQSYAYDLPTIRSRFKHSLVLPMSDLPLNGETVTNSKVIIEGKLLKSITTNTNEKIEFLYESCPRLDLPALNYDNKQMTGGFALKSIEVYRGAQKDIYTLRQSYFNVPNFQSCATTSINSSRLKLLSLTKNNDNPYSFEYYEDHLIPGRFEDRFDDWGFCKDFGTRFPNDYVYFFNEIGNRNPDLEFTKLGVLKKIKFPTGGYSVFRYELNEFYGNKPARLVNPPIDEEINLYINDLGYDEDPSTYQYLSKTFVIPDSVIPNSIIYSPTFSSQANTDDTHQIHISITDQSGNSVYNISHFGNEIQLNLGPGTYNLLVTGTFIGGGARIKWYRNPNISSVMEGNFKAGGLRIKSIFTHDNTNNLEIVKKKFYEYNQINDPIKSSGKITALPSYSYLERKHEPICNINNPGSRINIKDYLAQDSRNILALNGFESSHIMYTNVQIYDDESKINGFTDYKYSFAEDDNRYFFQGKPTTPASSYDFKRGDLLEQTDYKALSMNRYNIVKKRIYEYKYNFTDPQGQIHFFLDGVLPNEKHQLALCYKVLSSEFRCYLGSDFNCFPTLFELSYYKLYSIWKYLKKDTEISFDSNGINSNTVVKEYKYNNPIHAQLTSKTTTNSTGQSIETKYYYPQDLLTEPLMSSLVASNRIAEPVVVEQYKAGVLLSKSKTVFAKDASTNNLLLPKNIFEAKFPNSLASIVNVGNLEKKITYDSYDNKGNVTQLTPESNVPTSIIWGYNQTQPIAKIENASYADVQSQVANLQTISNTGTEANLLIALNTLRNSLPNAMVTAYTYKPLVGVSTITDAKGDKITYNYDSFGRLQNVTDKNGNILTENQYNYKQ